MSIEVRLTSDAHEDDELQATTNAMIRALRFRDGVTARVATRGGALLVGVLELDVLEPSACNSVFDVMDAFLSHDRSLSALIARQDGSVVDMTSTTGGRRAVEDALSLRRCPLRQAG